MSWFIRKATSKDKKDIISFFKSYIWASKDGEELYSWKYEDNPSGSALIWLAVEEKNDSIVGISVMMPWKLQLSENIVVSFQGVDALVDKNYRRQGIHKTLIRQALSEFKEMRIPFIFAFPNENSRFNLLKTGWHEIGFVRSWAKPFKAECILSKVIGRNFISNFFGFFIDIWLRLISRERFYHTSSKYIIKEIREFDERFDILWERVSKNFRVIGSRDSKYLNWKYINTPNKRHIVFSIERANRLAGYVVLEIGRGRERGHVCIVDIFTERDDEIINSLIANTIQYFRNQNISIITFLTLEDNFYVKYFKNFGFYLCLNKNSRKPFFVYIFNSAKINIDILLSCKNWFLTPGDYDIENVLID